MSKLRWHHYDFVISSNFRKLVQSHRRHYTTVSPSWQVNWTWCVRLVACLFKVEYTLHKLLWQQHLLCWSAFEQDTFIHFSLLAGSLLQQSLWCGWKKIEFPFRLEWQNKKCVSVFWKGSIDAVLFGSLFITFLFSKTYVYLLDGKSRSHMKHVGGSAY